MTYVWGAHCVGGTVHLVCRNQERGEAAKTEITETTGNQNVFMHQLDTSRPAEVYSFVKRFESSGQSLDVLINNAGCMVNTRELTEEGLEKNFATNTLGGMLTQSLNTDDLQFERMRKFDGTVAYAQNKRQQIVMCEQYAKQFPNVHFSTMHPGWADTPDRKAVSTHLPLAFTKSTIQQDTKLIDSVEEIAAKFKPAE
ncbi:DHR12-like protein [Mya arenaria]|uniref:DHR12-like protein n=1 Tax=Mya arenaria TaxID=6604 RepID=A0ABY7G2K8_MYAAR|nr:DHR12-like protein [Mya arenaria]